MLPIISIIIPVYNVEEYIRNCLDSLLNQNCENYEIICVNDGSTDSSPQILDDYASNNSNIRVFHQENKGVSVSRNTGIGIAQGEYILFVDSDDWIEENTLEELVKRTRANLHDMICFNGRLFHENSKIFEADRDFDEESLSGWEYYNKYAIQSRRFHFVCVVLRLYKRKFLTENELWFKAGVFHEDNLFTPIACYHARSVLILNKVLYTYRIRTGSIMQRKSLKRIQDKVLVNNELSNYFISIKNIQKDKLYIILASDYINIHYQIMTGEFKDHLKDLKRGINYKYFWITCITFRHRFLFTLILINPTSLVYYFRIIKLIKR